jgi:Alpha/beta hydrolase domain
MPLARTCQPIRRRVSTCFRAPSTTPSQAGHPQEGIHQHLSNPLDTAPLLRALLDALDRWVSAGTPPPPSHIPTRADGTLLPAPAVQAQFPRIPGVACPSAPNQLCVQDYGPEFPKRITQEPPHVDTTRAYAVLVPCVDADGNDVPGIRTPHVEVPLATFTGWNPRAEGYGAPALTSIVGSYLPFTATAAQRRASSDPRPSLAERYRSQADYVRRIAVAAQKLINAGLLLEEDAERYVERAMQENIGEVR